jgi:hypothetical protein
MGKTWRGQHHPWVWLAQICISFLLVITIFSNFSLAIKDLDIRPGEIQKISTIGIEVPGGASELYELEVTKGRGQNEGYAVGIPKEGRKQNNVRFDGYDETTGTLQGAKACGYKVNNNGQWSGKTGQRMRLKLIATALRQKNAATLAGKKVEWIVSEEKYLKPFKEAIATATASDIVTVRYQAPSEAVKELCKKKKPKDSSH